MAVLENAGPITVSDIFRAEFANVVKKWAQAHRPPIAEKGHPVFDAFYVALARQDGTRVVTYDKRLRDSILQTRSA